MRILMVLFALAVSAPAQSPDKPFLPGYRGQTTAQLIALAREYRTDSVVLAFEEALQQKSARRGRLSPAESDVLVVEAMEREVNNGGFLQLFTNAAEHVPALPAALARIGCPTAAKIATDALAALRIDGPPSAAKVAAAMKRVGEKEKTAVAACDARYFQNPEPIADRLFAYIQAKQAEIVLK